MKVHHLNCGTMHPPRAPYCVCHVLLVETDNGLVLVDAGFGIEDCADPTGTGGAGPVLHPAGVRPDRNGGTPARPTWLPPRRRPPHRPHASRHRPCRRRSRLPARADPRHLRRGVRRIRFAHARGEGPLRPAAVGCTSRTSSNTARTENPGAASPPPRSSPTSLPASCSSRCPDIPEGMPASRSTPATAGCCTAVTPSTTTATWTAPMYPAACGPWKHAAPSTESRCTTTTLGSLSFTAAPRRPLHRRPLTTRRCSSAPRPDSPRAPAPLCRRSRARPESGVPQRRWRTARLRGRRGRRRRRPAPPSADRSTAPACRGHPRA